MTVEGKIEMTRGEPSTKKKGKYRHHNHRPSRRRGYEDRHTFDVLTIEAFAILAEHVGGEAFAIEFETF